MFLVPTGVDTDDTHSDDLPVPKKTEYKKDDLPWYNNFEKDRDSMIDMIAE